MAMRTCAIENMHYTSKKSQVENSKIINEGILEVVDLATTGKKRKETHMASREHPLLEVIPRERLSPEQLSFGIVRDRFPLYQCLREPKNLNDFDWETNPNCVIWRDSNTLICVGDKALGRFYPEKQLYFRISHDSTLQQIQQCKIYWYGKSDNAIAETATFF
jgi:hypothetical protein